MSSDNTSHPDGSLLTIIPLANAHLEAPFVSSEAVEVIRAQEQLGKKTLLFYSRRGNARAWICRDCGHFEKCPNCDTALAYHTTPTKRLICHQCSTIVPFPVVCPHCQGSHIAPVGVGIQQIEEGLRYIFPSLGESGILRIDSDMRLKTRDLPRALGEAHIILATDMAATLVHPDIGAVIFLSFELNLSLPEYDIEEEIFAEMAYYKKQDIPIYAQTYVPEHPLLQEVVWGNMKSFFTTLKKERKAFHYPPFSEFATLRIHDDRKPRVTQMMTQLIQKISFLKWEDVFLAFDQDIWEWRSWEWSQKIILKWAHIMPLIRELEVEIVRNRMVTLEWN